MAIHRGEVYDYQPVLPPRPGQSTARLIVSVDELNGLDDVTCVGLLVDDLDRGGLLTVRVGHRWANVVRIERLLPKRVGELLYRATDEEMDTLDGAMRTAYGL